MQIFMAIQFKLHSFNGIFQISESGNKTSLSYTLVWLLEEKVILNKGYI